MSSPNAGAYATGKISDEERLDVVRHACPGSGACGGMFTCVDLRGAFIDAFLKSTMQGQHDGDCPRSFGLGPSIFFWDPRHLPREGSGMFQSPKIPEKFDGARSQAKVRLISPRYITHLDK